MSEAPSTPGPAAEPRRLGFDLPEEQWLSRLRQAEADVPLGRLGPYELLAELGRGGQGVVYKARQPKTDRIIALKRVSSSRMGSSSFRGRFEREIKAAASLRHPNLVTVYGCELIDGQPVLLMELVDGSPIDAWANPSGRAAPSLRQKLDVFMAVCDAVSHAHQHGIIHRDLKPSNILVTEGSRGHGAEGSTGTSAVTPSDPGPLGPSAPTPRILDFGLAKLLGDSGTSTLSRTADFVGTPAYAAPEQLTPAAKAVDVRSDIYALGVVLYQMLTGRSPYGDDLSLPALLKAIEQTQPARPSSQARGLDRDLDTIVLKALAKDKRQRYQSAASLRDDIGRYLNHEPIHARPPSTLYLLRKFVQRHPGAAAMGAALAVATVAFSIGVTTLYFRAEQAAKEARGSALRAFQTSQSLLKLLEQLDPTIPERSASSSAPSQRSATDTLDAIVANLPEILARQEPWLRISTLTTLANLYIRHRPAAPDKPEALLRQAIALLRESVGASGSELASVLLTLANVIRQRHAYAEAEALVHEAAAIVRSQPAALGPRMAVMFELAGLHTWRSRFLEAADAYDEALTLCRTDPNCAAVVEVQALFGLGEALWSAGQVDAGRARLVEGFRIASTRPHDLVLGLGIPARCPLDPELSHAAASSLRQRLNEEIERYGAGSTRVADTHVLLAQFDALRGDYAEAIARYESALAVRRARFGPEAPLVVSTLQQLAGVHQRRGDAGATRAVLLEAWDVGQRAYADSRPALLNVALDLAFALEPATDGRSDRGELEAFGLEMHTRFAGNADNPEYWSGAAILMGVLHMGRGAPAAAEPYLREAAWVRERAWSQEHWLTAYAQAVLGLCVARLERFDEAEALLCAAYPRVAASRGAQHGRTLQIMGMLAELYESAGDGVQARTWRGWAERPQSGPAPASRSTSSASVNDGGR